ncbi:uncharacterized protein [Montipora capricornis]|uniref:uncharacterized protein isoform X1 n=1 Tax=Montipora capricornis TaxID=246305 RepID=UPI0035F109BA
MVFTVPDWFLVEQSEEHSAAIDRRTYFTTSALKSLCCQILCAICWKSFQPAYAQLVVDLGMMFLPLAVMDKKISMFSCIHHLSLSGSTTGIPDILTNIKGK